VKRGLVVDLGVREYADCWELQKRLLARRQSDSIPDTLLLVEHPEVITLGRKAGARANILDHSIPIFEIERGGDVTYHGPGQLVGYPIFRLDEDERDLHAYLRNLEAGLIALCAAFDLDASRKPGLTGVWLGEKKVASIGIAVRRWVTLHGFALNVSTNLARFTAVNPCGLDAGIMTSLSRAAARPITVDEVKPLAAAHLGPALARTLEPASLHAVDE
jgi:lipoate-protein ligase B